MDYVRDKSPAANAGIKRGSTDEEIVSISQGDVILSVNGLSAIGETHTSLVTLINSLLKMKLVLIFQVFYKFKLTIIIEYH